MADCELGKVNVTNSSGSPKRTEMRFLSFEPRNLCFFNRLSKSFFLPLSTCRQAINSLDLLVGECTILIIDSRKIEVTIGNQVLR